MSISIVISIFIYIDIYILKALNEIKKSGVSGFSSFSDESTGFTTRIPDFSIPRRVSRNR